MCFPRAPSPADERLAGTIDRAHELARSGLDEARRAIGMLRDDELPGPDRLAALTAAFQADTGAPARFSSSGTPRELASAVRLALYRVTQEALTNVRKHARPERVEVRLDYLPDQVSLAVEDQGGSGGMGPPRSGGFGGSSPRINRDMGSPVCGSGLSCSAERWTQPRPLPASGCC